MKINAPKWLCNEAVTIFNSTVVDLGTRAKNTDTALIAHYSQAVADVARLTMEVREDGEIIISDRTGSPYTNPLENVLNARRKDFVVAQKELFGTPRSRGEKQSDGKKNPLERFKQ